MFYYYYYYYYYYENKTLYGKIFTFHTTQSFQFS